MKVTVVHGSPMSGKSTYVERLKGSNDLVYDFDLIMSAISGKETHNHNENLVRYVVDIRDLIINKLIMERNIDNAWIITTYISKDIRERLEPLDTTYHEVETTKEIAMNRLMTNAGGRDVRVWTQLIEEYFKDKPEVSQAQKEFYYSKQWKSTRAGYISSQDNICERCNRACWNKSDSGYQRGKEQGLEIYYGVVHHKEYITPENINDTDITLNWDNLEYLCSSCHSKEHHGNHEIRDGVTFDEEGNING